MNQVGEDAGKQFCYYRVASVIVETSPVEARVGERVTFTATATLPPRWELERASWMVGGSYRDLHGVAEIAGSTVRQDVTFWNATDRAYEAEVHITAREVGAAEDYEVPLPEYKLQQYETARARYTVACSMEGGPCITAAWTCCANLTCDGATETCVPSM